MRRAAFVAGVFFRRDWSIDLAYKAALALELLDVAVAAVAFYFFSQVLAGQRPAGYDAFAFLLVGVAVNGAMTTTLTCFAQAVRADQRNGVVKPLAASPLPPAALLALSGTYPVLRALVGAAASLAAGAAFGLSFAAANLPALAAACAAATLAFATLGALSAVFTIVLKRGDPVLWAFGTVSWLLGGVFFPVTILPAPLQQISVLLPMTHALDAIRATLLDGASLAQVGPHLQVLAAITLVGLPTGAAGLGVAMSWSRRTGTLGHA